jgi:hypothetical protein
LNYFTFLALGISCLPEHDPGTYHSSTRRSKHPRSGLGLTSALLEFRAAGCVNAALMTPRNAAAIARRPLSALKLFILSDPIDAIKSVEVRLRNHTAYPRNLKWILLEFPIQVKLVIQLERRAWI